MIQIITDSHSGITQKEAKKMGIEVLPMPFMIDGRCYEEDVTLSRESFFQKLKEGAKVSTSQPSPDVVGKLWSRVLKHYDQIVYIPISSGLSSSCSTAAALAQQKPYRGRVFVVDNGRVSTPQRRSVMDAIELKEKGCSAAQIQKILERARQDMTIYVTVEDLQYLKRGGRISASAAAIGSALNIKPVLQFDTGMIHSFQKCRGFHKARKLMIDAMRSDLEGKFLDWSRRGAVYLLAASSASLEVTESWLHQIREAFPGMDVLCDNLSLGVSCHIGPGGLGIGCSCRPEIRL